jgi:hypothetical protein
VWLAVERSRNEIIDIQVSKSREFVDYYQMASRIRDLIKYSIYALMAMKLMADTEYQNIIIKQKRRPHWSRVKILLYVTT